MGHNRDNTMQGGKKDTMNANLLNIIKQITVHFDIHYGDDHYVYSGLYEKKAEK